MISVCIPVFNADVRKLAESLSSQAGNIPAEIILIDDGSLEEFRQENRTLSGPGIQYHEMKENIGRAKIRNRFTEYANYGQLLFLDCDSVIISDTFLSDYALTLGEHTGSVICGGRIYGNAPYQRNTRLHWKYGTKTESRPAQLRQKDPKRSFMSSNFLVPLDVLSEIPFDERLGGYGHEDSLFGYELSKAGKNIIHIDNPVEHGVLETNRVYLEKTAEAVRNLLYINEMVHEDPGFQASIRLLRTAGKIERMRLAGVSRVISYFVVPLTRWLLSLGVTNLKLLDAYKLGFYFFLNKK